MASVIEWTKVKALSFDIYGTLLDWENGIADAARATSLGPYLPSDHRQLLLDIEKQDTTVQREHPTMRQTDIIAEGLKRYAAELKVVEDGKLSQDQIDHACKEYGGKIGEYPAFLDTVDAMQRLGKHYKLAPLSNVDHKSFNVSLSKALKGVHFDAIYTAEDVGSYKPNPRNFEYLLKHSSQDFDLETKEQLCHVAQSLFHDHGPASKLGIQSVWVDRKGVMGGEITGNTQETYGYKLKVDSLGELADIVDAAFSKA